MCRVIVSYSQPIRFARFDGKSVNRGLPVLDKARALDPCRRSEGSWLWGRECGNFKPEILVEWKAPHVYGQSRSQSPRVFWSTPRHGADQRTRGLWERDWYMGNLVPRVLSYSAPPWERGWYKAKSCFEILKNHFEELSTLFRRRFIAKEFGQCLICRKC